MPIIMVSACSDASYCGTNCTDIIRIEEFFFFLFWIKLLLGPLLYALDFFQRSNFETFAQQTYSKICKEISKIFEL